MTIAGESAGSFSVFYHMMSPGSKVSFICHYHFQLFQISKYFVQGLFHRIIGQSGMAGLAPSYHHWAGDQAIRLGTELAVMLGCTSPSTEHKLQCLKQQTPMALQVSCLYML